MVFFVKVTKTDGRGLERDRGANQNAKKNLFKALKLCMRTPLALAETHFVAVRERNSF